MSALAQSDSGPDDAATNAAALEAAFIAAGGGPVAMDRARPLEVTDPTRAWAVVEGSLDLFLVAPADAHGASRRTFLVRVPAGQVLFGLAVIADLVAGNAAARLDGPAELLSTLRYIGRKILAVPVPGTRCVGAALASLQALSDPEQLHSFILGVEDCVERLSRATRTREFPTRVDQIAPNQPCRLAERSRIVVGSGIAWVSVNEGRVLVNGLPEAGLVPGQGYPLSRDTWLDCEAGTVLAAVVTREVIAERRLAVYLQALHERLIARAISGDQLNRSRDQERVGVREAESRRVVTQSLHRLGAVIYPGLDTQTSVSAGESLPQALSLVGRACGIQFRPPQARQLDQPAPPSVEDYVREARARHRVVALRGNWWQQDNGPLLGFIEASKVPVALLPTRRKGYLLHNPVDGTVTPVDRELAASIAPMAHAFFRGFDDQPLTAVGVWRFGSFGLFRDAALVIFVGLCAGLLGLMPPYVSGILFDSVIPGADRGALLQLALILLGTAFASSLFELCRSLTMLRFEGKMDSAVQAAVWDRLLRLPVPFFRQYSAGDLALRANGINAIRQQLSGAAMHTLLSSVFSLLNLVLLFYYSSKLAWIGLLLVAVLMGLTVISGLVRLHYERRIAEIAGRLASTVLEFLSGISKLRTTGAEGRAFSRWAERYAAHESLVMSARFIGNILGTVTSVYPLLCTGVIFFAIFHFSKDAQNATALSTGEYLAFNAAFGAFMGAMVSLTGTAMTLLAIVPMYERAKPILETAPESALAKGNPGTLSGDIEVNGLSFRYSDDSPTVLRDISLRIRSGEYIAFVGPSGSGKSSLLRILLGFEKPSSGTVFYDGQDLSSIDVAAARRQFGVVLQNGQLLAGDIYSNIVGSTSLTINDAREAARASGLEADIDVMPMGMHTLIPDGGGTLSGGQRQRLLIARAIVTRPRILFFDEATSALDNRSQAIVTGSLDALKSTRVVIAHRLSTITGADRIYVLERGRIVQQGSFQQLMDQPGLFRELASRQTA